MAVWNAKVVSLAAIIRSLSEGSLLLKTEMIFHELTTADTQALYLALFM
jgi:hypothetical protein